MLRRSATEGAPSPECTIKAIINRNGERIYHTERQTKEKRKPAGKPCPIPGLTAAATALGNAEPMRHRVGPRARLGRPRR